jgi:class 3 adenylate cyclase
VDQTLTVTSERSTGLVGRREERAALSRWLREAMGGAPRIAVVSGDPGMGKTMLLRWLVAEARAAGATTSLAAVVEGMDVPFLPAGQLLAGLPPMPDDATDGDDTALWGATAHHLVRAVERVSAAAARAPVVLVLDDLQWADEATAGLAQHLAFHAATANRALPLLLVVAVRSGDGLESAGTRAARRLQREEAARTMHVGPLDEVDVGELCRTLTGNYPSNAELRSVLASTGGSPLLVRALVEGRRGNVGGRPAEHAALDLLEGRLTGLGLAPRRAVETLAVVGQRTPISMLAALVGDEYERLIDPVIERGLLGIDGNDVTFEHSLYRHAVLQSIEATRRAALERHVTAVISSPEVRGLMPVAAIAAHLRATPGDTPSAVVSDVLWRAGEEAFAAGAWGTAADEFLAALAVPGNEFEADAARWFRAGEAAFRDHDGRCAAPLRRAIDLAAETDQVEVLAPATTLLVRGLLTLGEGARSLDGADVRALELAGRPDPRLDPWRAALFGVAAECRFGGVDVQDGLRLAQRARDAATASPDPESVWAVELGEGLQHLGALHLQQAADCFDRAAAAAESARSDWHLTSSRLRGALVSLMRGDIGLVARQSQAAMEVANRCHHWAESSFGGALRTAIAALRADAAVENEAEMAVAMHRRTAYVFSPTIMFPALACSRAARGDIDGARDALRELEQSGHRAGSHHRALGRYERLLTGVADDESRPVRAPRPAPPALITLAQLASAAEAAADGNDRPVQLAYAATMDGLIADGLLVTSDWPHFLPRIRAELAVAMGEPDASVLLERAVTIARAEGMVLEVVRLELLRSVLADGAVAAEHASRALRAADRAGLLTFVAAASRRLHELGASGHHSLARAVLNTDIVQSTQLTLGLGDDLWLVVLEEHDVLVRAVVRRFGGVVFKHTGDGVYAWFVSPSAAVDCTQTLLAEFEGRRFNQGRTTIQIRAGLSLGEPVGRGDGDLFGVSLIEAARLCSAARNGRGLATAEVTRASGRPLVAHGPTPLKGFDEPLETFEVAPAA